MVAIFSGFSEREMTEKRFVVIEVEGMCINSNLEARSSQVGYLVMTRQNENMDHFFYWYDDEIVNKYYRELLFLYKDVPVNS